jgi:hypothetical protein
MALFDERAESEATRAVALVEEAIRKLGIDPAAAKAPSQDPKTASYALRRGSARILVSVHRGADGREGTLRVGAPVVKLPEERKRAEMYLHLLELNARELVGAAFGVLGAEVVVITERALKDLDASEVDAAIRGVGRIADAWDDTLASRFGAKRASD